MGNTLRSVARLLRALVHCILAWEAMVEEEVLRDDRPTTKEKYYAALVCIESVLGSEWKSKLELMPSRGKAYDFMAEVLSKLLGVKVTADDVVPRYFDQQGNQSFKATQECLKQLTEKGVCLLERYKTDIRPPQQQQQQSASCPAAAVPNHSEKGAKASTLRGTDGVCSVSRVKRGSQNSKENKKRPSSSNKASNYCCDKGASKFEPTAGDAMNDDVLVLPAKTPRLARPASPAHQSTQNAVESPQPREMLNSLPMAQAADPEPILLPAEGSNPMHVDDAYRVPGDLLGDLENEHEADFDHQLHMLFPVDEAMCGVGEDAEVSAWLFLMEEEGHI